MANSGESGCSRFVVRVRAHLHCSPARTWWFAQEESVKFLLTGYLKSDFISVMPASKTAIRSIIERATYADIPALSDLLLTLYEDECPRILPQDHSVFRAILAHTLARSESALESMLVVRDDASVSGRPVASIMLSPSNRPRRSSLDMEYIATALIRLGIASGAQVVWEQLRLMNLLCAPLPPSTAQVHSLVIDREHRGRGIGTRLMLEAEELARTHGDRYLLLYVLEGNDVAPMYSKLGYKQIPVPSRSRIIYPGISMVKDL